MVHDPKEIFIEAHEELIAEYMEFYPGTDWSTAYGKTSDAAYGRMQEKIADLADHAYERYKDEQLRKSFSGGGSK